MTKKVRIDESHTFRSQGASVTTKADPIEIELDPLELGRQPAEALAKSIAEGIRSAPQASPGTIRQRRAKGIPGTAKWVATGHLAESIRADRGGGGYEITAPSDRLQDPALLEKLEADVPAVSDPITPAVDAAIEKTAAGMVTVRRRT